MMGKWEAAGGDGRGWITSPTADGYLRVRGGVGSIRFQLEELADGAQKLDELAAEMESVEAELRLVADDLRQYQEIPIASGRPALAAVAEAARAIATVRMEVQRLGVQVRASKRDYEAAEVVAAAARLAGIQSLEAVLESHGDFWRTGFLNGYALERIAAPAVVAIPLLKALVQSTSPAAEARAIRVRQEERVPIHLDPTPAGLLERVRLIDQRGSGFIEVLEIPNGGGTAFVVVIPGTQLDDAGAGSNPFGLRGIVDGIAASGNVTTAVMEALQAAGAQRGAPVVGVGYSQGGIHAMNLAADEAFISKYDLKYVLTAGSPVSGITPAPEVSTLHLEHRSDWVPGTDGGPNRDTRNQVTATMTNDLFVQTGADAGIGPGHALAGYQEGARLIAASRDASLVGSTAVLAGALGVGGAATATRFSLTRSKGAGQSSGTAAARQEIRR